MKPDTITAMQSLIQQVRSSIPFDLPMAYICSGKCNGCSQKLLDFLSMELEEWEDKLSSGVKPNLADIKRLAKTSRKIHAVLVKNELIDANKPQKNVQGT